MIKKIELLSPAGSPQALHAAVDSGANAVYLGFEAFSARAGAENFNSENIAENIAYCHLHGVQVHVTVNTLVKQAEIPQLIEVLKTLDNAGADAVIVQDMGVACIVKQSFPNLKIHASTQMSINSVFGAKMLLKMGFDRAVLARECSIETIKDISATGIETEVFVHGALCIGMSGQCLLSSMAGGRSGNRGRCAQPCRQALTFRNEKAMHLSPRDLMLYDVIPQLEQAGVSALKIEGRLKSPAYVSTVTDIYHKALYSLANGTFKPADDNIKNALMQAFNRGEFSKGYAGGSEDAAIINSKRSNNAGIYIGDVTRSGEKLIDVKLLEDLNDGDGLRILGQRQEDDIDFTYSGNDTLAGDIAKVRLRPNTSGYSGDKIYRLSSSAQAKQASQAQLEPITLSAEVVLKANQPLRLTLSDDISTVEMQGAICQEAQSHALSNEKIEEQIRRTGGTPFRMGRVAISGDEVFLPVSAVNKLRRKALEALKDAIIARNTHEPKYIEYEASFNNNADSENKSITNSDRLIIVSSDAKLSQSFIELSNNVCFVYEPHDLRQDKLFDNISKLAKGSFIALPTQCTDKDTAILLQAAKEYKQNISGLMLCNVGQAGLDTEGFDIAFGQGVPVMNAYATQALEQFNPQFISLSPELTLKEIHALPLNKSPYAIKLYGRERLMILHHCPARTSLKLSQGHENCTLCDSGDVRSIKDKYMTDRKGYNFPLTAVHQSRGCTVEMHNGLPTSLHKQYGKIKKLPLAKMLHFTNEDSQLQLDIAKEFIKLINNEECDFSILEDSTTGHLLHGVE